MSKSQPIVPADYAEFLSGLKHRIRDAHITATRAVNRELILLYWDIGRAIVEKQQSADWGDSVVERLSADLRAEFSGMRGFSANNVWLMRQFYTEYSSKEFLEQLVQELQKGSKNLLEQAVPETGISNAPPSSAQESEILEQPVQELEFWPRLVAKIPWGHHIELLKKVKAPAARLYYLCATARLGWSRRVLLNQIKAKAYERSVEEK